MTTTLLIVLDPPPGALHDEDPIGWTAGYVRGKLLEAGLVVHDVDARPDLILGVQPPARPAGPSEHPCPLPWCQAVFAQAHHVKMHMRSHTEVACQFCGSTYKLTGLHSHEQHCPSNPERPAPPVSPVQEPLTQRARRVQQAARPAPPPVERPAMPELGPIERRPFDADAARAAAGGPDLAQF